jgi:HTH-type transcriptional regulator/antitoxin MqsA
MDEHCWLCGAPASLVTEGRRIPMLARDVVAEDRFYRCTACGEEFYGGGMMDATLRKATSTIQEQDALLKPEEIRAIRTSYGLTQAALETLINAGCKTVVRWEHGTVAQNATADTLLRVLRDHPEVVARLAEERGVRVRLPEMPSERTERAPVDEPRDGGDDVGDVRHAA